MRHDDGIMEIYDLTNESAPDKRRLTKKSEHWYGERTVGVTRLYAAMQANRKVDMLLEIWEDRSVQANQYAIPEDGRQYLITDVRHTLDDTGLRISLLTLERVNRNYELEQTAPDRGSAEECNGQGISL